MDALRSLKATILFRQVPDAVLKVVSDCVEERSVPAGECIVEETERAGALYLVRNGTVRFFRGGTPTQFVMGPGESFGEVAFLDGGPMGLTAQALERTDLLVLRAERVRAKLGGDHQAGHVLFRSLTGVLAGRLRRAGEILMSVADRAPT